MTGPAEGKISLNGVVEFKTVSGSQSIDCDIYLHVKGYSLARVTHVDLENPVLNELLPPKKSLYLPFRIKSSKIEIILRDKVYMKSLGTHVHRLIIYCPILASSLGEGVKSSVYIGGKYGGIFLGFKKEYVRRLESLAVKLGVKPRGKKLEV